MAPRLITEDRIAQAVGKTVAGVIQPVLDTPDTLESKFKAFERRLVAVEANPERVTPDATPREARRVDAHDIPSTSAWRATSRARSASAGSPCPSA